MWNGLVIFLGGGLGSLARWWASVWIASRWGQTFPWGTLFVNVTGSVLIGFFAAMTGSEGRWMAPVQVRQFFMAGICGGYTTFSSFSLQTFNLMQEGLWMRAGVNILLSVTMCLVGVWLGHLLAVAISVGKGA